MNKYAVTPEANSPPSNKLTKGTGDAPDLVKLSANCLLVLTHDICSISLFFITPFNTPMSIRKRFSVTYLCETKASQSDLLSLPQCIGIFCSYLS